MIDHKGKSGIISKFVEPEELDKWVHLMKQFDTTTFYQPQSTLDIGDCYGVDSSNKKGFVFFEHVIMKKLRASFSTETKLIYGMYVHSTSPIKEHVDVWDKPPYVSCLIPVSVDEDKTLCDRSSTIVNNVEHVWKHGDLVWWDSTLPHSSNDFTLTNTSKQSIVIHTYV